MSRAPLALVAILALAAPGCRATVVTPVSVLQASAPQAEREQAVTNWKEAVVLANEFLASPFRLTLPEGHFELDDWGMRFVRAAGEVCPITVCSTTMGDICVSLGYAAQEREYGFAVGARDGEENDPVIDNSLFRLPDGSWRDPPDLAKLILHETTHVVFRVGTIGFWNTVSYYLEAIFLLRSSTHSAERLPRATSEEFFYYYMWRSADPALRPLWEENFRLRNEDQKP